MKQRIRIAVLLIAVLLSVPRPTSASAPQKAHTLELNDSCMVIKGLGITKGGVFQPLAEKNKAKALPTPIIINRIEINYKGHANGNLVFTANDSAVFKTTVTNSLDNAEIKKLLRNNDFALDTLKRYAFCHGDRIWTLSFNNQKDTLGKEYQSTSNAKAKANASDKLKDKVANIAIISLLVIFLLVAVYIIWAKKKRSNNNQGKGIGVPTTANDCEKGHATAPSDESEPTDKTQPANETEGNNDSISTRPESTKPDPTETDNNQEQEVAATGTPINTNHDENDETNASSTDKNADSVNENAKLIKSILDELHLDENKKNEIVNKIKSLKQEANDKHKKSSIQEEFASGLIKKIEKIENKAIKKIVDKAKEEVENSGPCYILDRFFKILSSQKETNTPTFESQINRPENRILLTKWCIEQLSMKGCKEFDIKSSPRPDEIFPTIAKILNQAEEYSKNNHVDKQYTNSKPTEEQTTALLNEIVEQINILLGEHKLNNIITIEALVQELTDVLASSNKTETPTTLIEKDNTDIDIVNNTFGSNISELSKQELITAATTFLKEKIGMTDNQSGENIFKAIKKDRENSQKLNKLLDEFKASSVEYIEEAIREKEYNQISKSVKADLEELLPNERIETLQQLINKLIKIGKSSKDIVELIVDDLDEEITQLDTNYKAGEQNAMKLIDTYKKLMEDKEKQLKSSLDEASSHNIHLQEQVSQKDEKISALNTEKEHLSETIVNALHTLAGQVEENINKTFMLPCSNDYESTCEDIEKRLGEELADIVKRLKGYEAEPGTNPAEIKHHIQDLLTKFLQDEYSPIDKVCRYYAYSQMAYMTDTSREEGIRFNRRNIGDLFASINNLYIYFGIRFDIPTLFVMSVDEGHFNDLTGQNIYGDLDNLLPNSRNRFDKIDSESKPQKAIVDIVKVGYSLDGELKEKTSVLTF